MKLTGLRIRNFRSIRDSGNIPLSKTTVLVGKNESGKSNVLYALEYVRDAAGNRLALPLRENFPADIDPARVEYDKDGVELTFDLEPPDRDELAEIWPPCASATKVVVTKPYHRDGRSPGLFYVEFPGVPASVDPRSLFDARITKLRAKLHASPGQRPLALQIDSSRPRLRPEVAFEVWRKTATAFASSLRQFQKANGIVLTKVSDASVRELEGIARSAVDHKKQAGLARSWVAERVPRFVYFDEYPDIPGRQSISRYLAHVKEDEKDSSDEAFSDLLMVAGVDLEQFQTLAGNNVDERAHRLRVASVNLTERVQALWGDQKVSVRLHADDDVVSISVSDESLSFGSEVNLENRSKGFQWFFGFITMLAAQLLRSSDQESVLLLDEAGLHLHPGAQKYLLKHLRTLPNQAIYCTHLPFMIPLDEPTAIMAVEFDVTSRTTIRPLADTDAAGMLLQALLGYHLAHSFLVSQNVLITEGVIDHWVISAISGILNARDGSGLDPSIALPPSNGLTKIAGYASLFRSNRLNVAVLLDSSAKSREYAKLELIRSKLVPERSILFVGTLLGAEDADIEDMLDEAVYINEVHSIYPVEMSRVTLDPRIPRIVKRLESAFTQQGLTFKKRIVGKRLSERIQRDPNQLSPEAVVRFQNLFREVEHALARSSGNTAFR